MRSVTSARAVSMITGTQRSLSRSARQTANAVAAGQHHVEHDGVVLVLSGLLERRVAVVRDVDLVALLLQAAPQRPRQLAVVLHDEQSHRHGGG